MQFRGDYRVSHHAELFQLIAFLQKLILKEHKVVIMEFPNWVQVKKIYHKHREVSWRNETAITDKFSELKEEMQSLTGPFEELISPGISKSEVFIF